MDTVASHQELLQVQSLQIVPTGPCEFGDLVRVASLPQEAAPPHHMRVHQIAADSHSRVASFQMST